MKYVRFRRRGEDRFLFTLAPTKHSDLADALVAAGWTPFSAGFVRFAAAGTVRTCGHSESLGLSPGPTDAQLIQMLNTATLNLVEPSQLPPSVRNPSSS